MRAPSISWLALPALVLGALVDPATARSQRAPAEIPSATWLPMLRVAVREGAIDAPDSARSGWTRLHTVKDGRPHTVVVFRLRDGVQPSAFLAALDTASATPSGGVALSGLEFLDSGELVIDLAPGHHVVACILRGADGRRHHVKGESQVLVAAPARAAGRTARLPRASAELRMMDFAYPGAERWRRGAYWVRVTNEGKQDHLVMIARLREGATLRDWAESKEPRSVAAPVTGAARMGAGATAYLPVVLERGRYVLYCSVPHGPTKTPHSKLGMFKEITVE